MTEQEMEDFTSKIEQLRQTIDGQELSQEDARGMEREKARIEEQISKQGSVLEEQFKPKKSLDECNQHELTHFPPGSTLRSPPSSSRTRGTTP